MSLPEPLGRELDRHLAEQQAEHRVPGLLAGVVRDGEVVWHCAVGAADVDRPDEPPTPDTGYAIGSITKTFTATLVMALRDEGRLDLDDRLGDYLPETRHSKLTVRRMLAHASGLQREPVGDVWDALQLPDRAALVAGLEDAEQVLAPRQRWHYSNLAYALLGEIVARIEGRPWAEALQTRILEPLGLRRTGLQAAPPAAVGYFVEPFTDAVKAEQVADLQALAPAGALWSTLEDLAGWADFLAVGREGVLGADTLAEMEQVQMMADVQRWQLAWGLGFELFRACDRVFAGHTGGMPGFLTAVVVERSSRTAAVVLANSIGRLDPGGLAVDLLGRALDEAPTAPEPWRPEPPAPADLVGLVGRWWSEGTAFEFFVRDGTLHARNESAPASQPPAVFERLDATTFRTVRGREQGELLRLTYDGDAVSAMHWATYRVTRTPEPFG